MSEVRFGEEDYDTAIDAPRWGFTQKRGDIFTTGCEVIAHGCNCEGMMGAGIAAQMRERHQHNYLVYREACDKQQFQPGGVLLVKDGAFVIANLASQRWPGTNALLIWITEAVTRMYGEMRFRGLGSVAFPRIGAGIGGLNWDDVGAAVAGIARAHPDIVTEFWTYA